MEHLDLRGAFVDLDRYHRGQICKETCAKNYSEELTAISLATGYTGGAEAFFNKCNSIIMKMKELYGG